MKTLRISRKNILIKKIFGARVVPKNADGMLEGDGEFYLNALNAGFQVYYYDVLSFTICAYLFCGSCKREYKDHVRDLDPVRNHMKRSEDTKESNLNRTKISNQFWIDYQSKLLTGTVERHLKIYTVIRQKQVQL